jgi:Pentapeptide repeats (8 copies)
VDSTVITAATTAFIGAAGAIAVALISAWVTLRQRRSKPNSDPDERAADQARENALDHYFDSMSEVIRDKKLRDSKVDDLVWSLPKERTLAVFRSLEGDQKGRKRQVVEFLYKEGLIGGINDRGERDETTPISLKDADLSGADLHDLLLIGADLRFAKLSNVDLRRAYLSNVLLIYADLRDAELHGAILRGAELKGADLTGAKNLTNQQLAQAESLVGATMPDGTRMTNERWEQLREHYRRS